MSEHQDAIEAMKGAGLTTEQAVANVDESKRSGVLRALADSGHPTTEPRTIDVAGGLVRHWFRQYLTGQRITWTEGPQSDYGYTVPFTITADPSQWEAINQWLADNKEQV